jgi:hypothetical protein
LIDRQTDRYTERQTDRWIWIYIYIYIQTDRMIQRQTQTDFLINDRFIKNSNLILTDRQAFLTNDRDRQIDK